MLWHGVLPKKAYLLEVSLYVPQDLAVSNRAQDANGVGSVEIHLTCHVLHQGADNDDDLIRPRPNLCKGEPLQLKS